jgi:amino-acid N-acetyltransferase
MINVITSIKAVKDLLQQCALPTADIASRQPPVFFGIHIHDRLTAVVGLELFGSVGLLRSLAVLPESRGQGLARRLVAFAEDYAASRGVTSLYLLTETAETFFRKIGYQPAARSDAPQDIRATSQFAGLCPASSSFLSKHLDTPV